MQVTIFTKANCPQCERTKTAMDILGIPYRTVDVQQNEREAARLMQAGFRSLPVVEAGDTSWCGYDEEKIKRLVSY